MSARQVSYSEYRELMQDAGAPTITTLSTSSHRTRSARQLQCGHDVEAGARYTEWVGLIDGEFTIHHDCQHCYDEMMG